MTRNDRPLLAILLNPPGVTSGMRTRAAVGRAANVLGFSDFEVVNLFAEPTPTVIELNDAVLDDASWRSTRKQITKQLASAGGVLAAWGVAGASRALRRERDKRASWFLGEAATYRHEHVWMVGGEPRHPSRWHQYVADKHARTAGGTLEERLAQVLTPVLLGKVTTTGYRPFEASQPSPHAKT